MKRRGSSGNRARLLAWGERAVAKGDDPDAVARAVRRMMAQPKAAVNTFLAAERTGQ